MSRRNKAKEIMELIFAEDLDLTEYSDTLVYRVVERMTVLYYNIFMVNIPYSQ